jgi:hypothetical protein
MRMNRTLVGRIAIGILSVGALVSLYQTLFSWWMCAHPVYRSVEWQNRFYLRVVTTAVIGAVWLLSVISMMRKRRQSGH